MKLKLLLVVGSLLALSCTNSEDLYMPVSEPTVAPVSQVRSAIDAIQIATQIAEMDNQQTRSSKTVSHFNVRPILSKGTRSTASDTVMYAVNFENNQGFVLISADKRVSPVLAVIDSGSYEDAANAENEAFQYALESMISYASVPKEPITPNPLIPNPSTVDTIYSRQKSEKLIEVAWGQAWPENIYCPNKIAGCGPVATAQILSVFKHPLTINYQFEERDMESETINWNSLVKHRRSLSSGTPYSGEITNHLNSCDTPLETHYTLARLVRQFGHMENADYLNNGTFVEYSPVVNTIYNLCGKTPIYSGYGVSDLFEKIIGDSKSLSLVGSGLTNENGNELERHLWVADGAWEIGMKIRYESPGIVEFPGQEPSTVITFKGEIYRYLHCNWGWSGNCNGYFLIDSLNPNDAFEYDNDDSYNGLIYTQATSEFRYSVYKL